MRRRWVTGARRRLSVVALATATLLGVAGPAAAAVDLGTFSGPVRFTPEDGGVLDLGARRYVGTVEARVGVDGDLAVIDELSFDAYLEGLAEVPVRWPVEALRAQVIAARTYVWWELSQGVWTARGYDICATQACQVFAGRDIAEVDTAGRWAAAVAATSGQVLVDEDGEPLLARYSSSNGGRSRANHEVFPDDGEWSYLQEVDDPFDVVSPFHRWQVTFRRADLDAVLARGETLSAAVPLADIRLVEVEDDEDLVEVTGQDGTVASVTASAFRFFVSREAPDVAPDRYPGPRPGGGRYPATLLSSQLAFTVSDDTVVVDGRGFGHGVGMGQYGALGRAEAGQTAPEILAAYYGGIRPTTPADVPTSVRVGLREGPDPLTVRPSTPTRVQVGSTVLTERALGDWQVEVRPDRTLRVLAPEGYGSPLVVDPTAVDRAEVWSTEVVALETVVNKHAELEVVLRGGDGTVLVRTPVGVVEPGRHTVDWSLDGPDGALLAPGAYEVALVAIDEEGTRAGGSVPFTVRAPAARTTASLLGPQPATPTAPEPWWLVVVGGLVGGALGGLAAGRRGTLSGDRRPS